MSGIASAVYQTTLNNLRLASASRARSSQNGAMTTTSAIS